MSKEGRHVINLFRKGRDIICQFDHKIPSDLSIRMFVGQGFEYWSPATMRGVGCGGSETAAAFLAKAFARRNCQPIIYAMDNQVWDGVIYRFFRSYIPDNIPCNLFISSRMPEVFNSNIPAEQKWLWFHDTDLFHRFKPEHAEQLNAIIALSQWHAGHLKRVYPFLKDAEIIDFDNNEMLFEDLWTNSVQYKDAKISKVPPIAIIGNGINTSSFGNGDKTPYRFAWCNSPDRGLEQVLSMWHLIKREMPESELKIFYGWDYFDNTLMYPQQRELKAKLKKLLQQEGVEWCGRVGQKQLAKELVKTDIMLYPPPHQFRETYGITFLEAQAAGVICFYRKSGALGETIGSRGIPLEMDAKPEEIVDKIKNIMSNKELCAKMRKEGREYAMGRDWSVQADKFLQLYRRLGDG